MNRDYRMMSTVLMLIPTAQMAYRDPWPKRMLKRFRYCIRRC